MNSALRSKLQVPLLFSGIILILLVAGVVTDSDVRVVVFGKTGVGKSSLANTLLDSDKFKTGVGSDSITIISQHQTRTVNTVIGRRRLSIVDTPGLFDTRKNNKEIAEEIGRCVDMSLPGPHVFILVISVTQRFTQEDRNTVKTLQKQFGRNIKEYMMVVFTAKHWLHDMSPSEYIEQSTGPLQEILATCSNRYAFIDTKDHASQRQGDVDDIMKIVSKIIKNNNGHHYTNQMYEEAVKRKEEEEEAERRKEKQKQVEEYKRWKAEEEEDKHERHSWTTTIIKFAATAAAYYYGGWIPALGAAVISNAEKLTNMALT